MKTPHDPTASTSTRFRTDVFPVSDRDADALDAWLDRSNGSALSRAGEPSTPVEPSTFGHNGQSLDAAAAASNGTFPLTAAAQRFHARLDDAERDHAPDVPEAAIWEKVMSNHLALEPALPAIKNDRVRTRNTHVRVVDTQPHTFRTFVGSNPAISAIFAIVVMIALVAVFRGMSENGSGPIPTAPTGGESHLAAITDATPNASGTPQANSDCVTRILTEEESAKIVSEWQAAPAPQLVPIQGPASAADAGAASNTYVKYFSCKEPKNVPVNLLTLSVSTTRSVFRSNQTRYIDTYVAQLKQQLAESRALSSALRQHYTTFVANADDSAVQPHIGRNSYGGEYAVLPQDFVILADGRIGAPIRTVLSGNEAASRPTLTAERQAATFAGTFIIFANVSGTWLIDETVALCVENCDQFFAQQQAEIDRLSPKSTPATPSGTAVATSTPTAMPIGGDNQRRAVGSEATTSTSSPFSLGTPCATVPPSILSHQFDVRGAQLAAADIRTAIAPQIRASGDDASSWTDNTSVPSEKSPGIPLCGSDAAALNAPSATITENLLLDLQTGNVRSEVLAQPWFTQYLDVRRAAAETSLVYQLTDGSVLAVYGVVPTPHTQSNASELPVGAYYYAHFLNENGNWTLSSQGIVSTYSADSSIQESPLDYWLRPISESDCVAPVSVPDSSSLSPRAYGPFRSPDSLDAANAAGVGRSVFGCSPSSNQILAKGNVLLTDRMQAESQQSGATRADQSALDAGRYLSDAYAANGTTLFFQKAPAALTAQVQTDPAFVDAGGYPVFLPKKAIAFNDGRIGVPISTLFFTDEALHGATDREQISTLIYVFASVDGTWLLDETIPLCFGTCDKFWSEQEAQLGTPSPQASSTPTEGANPANVIEPVATTALTAMDTPTSGVNSNVIEPVSSATATATASAEDARRLPVPPATCTIPAATAAASDLPNRSYNRLMMPTTNKADGAAAAAQNVIACFEAEAAVATPGSSLQPLMTDRLQQEVARGSGEPVLTSMQIDGARSVSAYLEQQKTYHPYERAAPGVEETPNDVWPGHFQGNSSDPTPGWYIIALPENAVQFPDGRIGVPHTNMVSSEDLWAYIASESKTSSTIYIFSPADGGWKLDEVLPLCFGDCDAFWHETTGTPASISDEASLQPITADECAVPAPGTGAEPQLSPRADRPISVPDPSDSKAIVSTARDYLACSQYGTGNNLGPFMTDRFQTQVQGGHGSSFLTEEDITAGKNLSAELAGGQGGYQFYVRGLPGADDTAATTQGFYEVALPDNALLLPDGRIAMPITQAYTSDSGLKEAQKSMSSVVSQTPYTVNVIIFASVEGTWKVDQQLPLCLQNCSDFWQQQEAQLGTPATSIPSPQSPGAPIASPVAAIPCVRTELTDEQVAQAVADFRSMPTPEYVPTKGIADESDAREAISSFQSLLSCESTPGVPPVPASRSITNMETDWMVIQIELASTPEIYADLLARDLTTSQKLSPVLVNPDPAQYIVDQNHLGDGILIPNMTTPQGMTSVLYPEDFVVLADGRIGAPVKAARPGGSNASATSTYLSPQTVQFVIFKQENGRWLFDEAVTLCTARCDQYAQIQEQKIEYFRSQSTPASTPSSLATPAAFDADGRRT